MRAQRRPENRLQSRLLFPRQGVGSDGSPTVAVTFAYRLHELAHLLRVQPRGIEIGPELAVQGAAHDRRIIDDALETADHDAVAHVGDSGIEVHVAPESATHRYSAGIERSPEDEQRRDRFERGTDRDRTGNPEIRCSHHLNRRVKVMSHARAGIGASKSVIRDCVGRSRKAVDAGFRAAINESVTLRKRCKKRFSQPASDRSKPSSSEPGFVSQSVRGQSQKRTPAGASNFPPGGRISRRGALFRACR